MRILEKTARSCTVLLDPDGHYDARSPRRLMLNGRDLGEEARSVCTLFDLWPDTEYTLKASTENGEEDTVCFRTDTETCTLDVRRFGAKGDGRTDDTAALQAAILACPAKGRVLLPGGVYKSGPLFLKSHITMEWKEGAVLSLLTDRSRFPILPGAIRSTDEQGECILGLWEGNPLDSFASALTGIGVEDVRLIGRGEVDGCAPSGDWWTEPKKMRGAFRPRLLYLKDCRDITVQGLAFRNSPAWNLHPAFSENLKFLNVSVDAPADSPNTDGFDPESCRHVKMYGTRFSVGDDCIAIKAGKIYLGMKYRVPCEDVEIAWCLMLDGHGGVTVGGEMAGGVRNVWVHHCLMRHNDRGLRIKTRRGRGKWGVIDGIVFEDVQMDAVRAPLVINSMYFCDPDGRSPFVQSREKQPVDDTTPTVGSILFERVRAAGCESCAAYILGLPEKPVEQVTFRDCDFSFAKDPQPMIPAMAEGVPPCRCRGVIASFVKTLRLERVTIEGGRGERTELNQVETLEEIPVEQ